MTSVLVSLLLLPLVVACGVVFAALCLALYRVTSGERLWCSEQETVRLRLSELLRAQASGEDTATPAALSSLLGPAGKRQLLQRCKEILADPGCDTDSRAFCASLIAQSGLPGLVDEEFVRALLRQKRMPTVVLASVANMAGALQLQVDSETLAVARKRAGDNPLALNTLSNVGVASG